MSSKYEIQNIRFTGDLNRPGTTKGSVLSNNGVDNFELTTPSVNGQLLVSDSSQSSGVKWSTGVEGLAVGFPIPNGITPRFGNTEYFLVISSSLYVPVIPVPAGVIIYFSVRPDNGGSGWTNASTNISGGSLDYTFGYITDSQNPTTGNFTAYAGTLPHYQVLGTSINNAIKNFSTFSTALNIAVGDSQQICVRITNNLTFSGLEPSTYTGQNALCVLRF